MQYFMVLEVRNYGIHKTVKSNTARVVTVHAKFLILFFVLVKKIQNSSGWHWMNENDIFTEAGVPQIGRAHV